MAVTSSGIIILPQAAATAGCSATATVVQEDDLHELFPEIYIGWWKLYSFSATAARGWVFDHWEQSWDYLDESYGQPTASGSKSDTYSRSPWSEANYAKDTLNTEEEDWGYITGDRGHWVRTITRLAAVFRSAHTGLILRSATSGAILHGSSNSILRDD